MDVTTILTNYGWAGIIAVALIYIYKSKEKSDADNLNFIKNILERAISAIDSSNIQNQDIRNELRNSQEQRKEQVKHQEWCKQVISRFIKINQIEDDTPKEGE